MEELTEVITAAEFHPYQCNTFVYSSSKGTIRLCDMRSSALCDKHSKREIPSVRFDVAAATKWQQDLIGNWILCLYNIRVFFFPLVHFSLRGARRSQQSLVLLWDHILHLRCQVQSQRTLYDDQGLLVCKDLGFKYGEQTSGDLSGELHWMAEIPKAA